MLNLHRVIQSGYRAVHIWIQPHTPFCFQFSVICIFTAFYSLFAPDFESPERKREKERSEIERV